MAVRDDSSSSQSVDATQIYLNEVRGVKKKRVYGLGSMGSLCLRSQASSSSICLQLLNQSKNLIHRRKKIVELRPWKRR